MPTLGLAEQLSPTMTWNWQLAGSLDTSVDTDLYDVDLFDVPRSTFEELKSQGRIVICYFSAGSLETWRSDADQFPDHIVGSPLDGWEGELWLDIRHTDVRVALEPRFDLAAEKGCDGIEPDNVDAYLHPTGFPLTVSDQATFNIWLAGAASERGLLIGLKNALELIQELEPVFDFALNEQCHEYDECDAMRPFVDAGKPVFNAEYTDSQIDAVDLAAKICADAIRNGLQTLILSLDLDGSFRVACN
jgi:hypothetical protein